jgi:hypothetical protein
MYALIEEGRIRETELGSGRFELTEKLSVSGREIFRYSKKDEPKPPNKWETLKNENPWLYEKLRNK